MIKEIMIFRSKPSDNPKAPSHRVMARVGDTLVELGAAWTQESKKDGSKYLSVKLRDEYKDHTDAQKSRKGWHIEEDGKKEEVDETEGLDIF
jgi:uncharacterized protein (DUF736 family)